MSERERAVQLLNSVPDNKMIYVIGFLEGVAIREDTDPFYSRENMERLERSMLQMEKTGGTLHEVNYNE